MLASSVLPRKKTWKELVDEQKGKLKGATCAVYSTTIEDTGENEMQCICGRSTRRHSYTGQPKKKFRNAEKWASKLAAVVDVTTYGQTSNGVRFIRCDTEGDTFETLIQMIVDDVGAEPKLLVSCYGGAEYFTMTDELEREFMNGIGQVAATEGVWILTTGLNSGVSNLIGQGIQRNALLNENTWKPVVIGMSHWYTISEDTRKMLKEKKTSSESITPQYASASLGEDETKMLDNHHTHFLLLDDGCFKQHLTDDPRSKFVKTTHDKTDCHAVTIIVEGGVNTLEVIQHDLQAHRPIVIVHGSGRLASVLGNLLEIAGKTGIIGKNELEQQLKLYPTLNPSTDKDRTELIEDIIAVLDLTNRRYLSLFQLGSNANLTNTIFQAVFDLETEIQNPEKLLKLALSWNCVDGAHDLFKKIQISGNTSADNINKDIGRQHYPSLFEQALKENRPMFVDYFLRRYHNPLETTKFIEYKKLGKLNVANESDQSPMILDKDNDPESMCVRYALQFIVETLYKKSDKANTTKYPRPCTLRELDRIYSELIGPYAEPFYRKRSKFERFRNGCNSFCCRSKWFKIRANRVEPASGAVKVIVASNKVPPYQVLQIGYHCEKSYGKQEMLRDIFLWSVYEGHIDIAFVLLLQLKSRIIAALVAAGMAHRLSLMSHKPHIRNTFNEHRAAYDEYATACIDACYKHNEKLTCELLLREIPLFGNITCMQAAIASRSIPFINTNSFNQALNQQWYGYLDDTSSETLWDTCKFTLHLLSFGVLAPPFLNYRLVDKPKEEVSSNRIYSRGVHGIEDQSDKETGVLRKWIQFHGSPIVMVFYDFALYIWFLLVFSYFMLFHMKSSNDAIHWTEIYIIITVTASLLEDIRKLIVEFCTQMLERWHRADLWILTVYLAPYILFYIGIGLHFGSKGRPDLFTAARVVLALNLEIWYLFSLRFVSAVKLLGPKLFMLRNMMRDLFGILYIIFVCIAAYGVVSRALTMYDDLHFTANNIASSIFYRPYWFLYSIVDDEKKNLDDIISSNTSTTGEIAEATVNHILLAFHMLFINILLLSLLIAMFNFSINDVQAMNKYFWRYQRYELVREYFEKPLFTFPPLSLLVYVVMLIIFVIRRSTRFRIFKRLATQKLDTDWTDFENAATYNHARGLVEEKYRPRKKVETTSSPPSEDGLALKVPTQIQAAINELQTQTKQIIIGMEQMLKAMNSTKTNDQ